MSMPLEHDYIGLTELSSTEEDDNNNVLNLKQTELTLGLPGSHSPQRMGLSLSLKGRGGVAKRGFSDATSPKWGFSGSQADWAQRGVMFSPRAGNGANMHNSASLPANGAKDVLPPTPTPKSVQQKKPDPTAAAASNDHSPPSKAQLVGWPPIRSFRKNTMAANPVKNSEDKDGKSGPGCIYVKVSMDGAPYLRKVDLKTYSNYMELSTALEKMFSCFTIGKCGSDGVQGRDGQSESRLMGGSECVLTFEDKEGDWMLVGDVPWDMFIESCKRLRIMKGSEAIGLAPKVMDKCKNRN